MDILIVDGDRRDGETVVALLASHGLSARHVATAKEARGALAQSACRLVITDVGLPEQDGIELVKSMQRDHSGVAVIAVTDRKAALREPITRLLALYGVEVLTKPLDPERLLASVRAALPGPPPAPG